MALSDARRGFRSALRGLARRLTYQQALPRLTQWKVVEFGKRRDSDARGHRAGAVGTRPPDDWPPCDQRYRAALSAHLAAARRVAVDGPDVVGGRSAQHEWAACRRPARQRMQAPCGRIHHALAAHHPQPARRAHAELSELSPAAACTAACLLSELSPAATREAARLL